MCAWDWCESVRFLVHIWCNQTGAQHTVYHTCKFDFCLLIESTHATHANSKTKKIFIQQQQQRRRKTEENVINTIK